jgi:exopolysaccharide production protein ExoZ
VPLYWVGTFGVFLLALVMPTLLNATRATLGNLVRSLFLIPYRREDGELYPMLFLGWTLEYEMFFYFIFGLALMFFKKWASLAASLTLIAIVVAGKVFHASSTIPQFYSNPLIIEFVFGMVVFALWSRYRSAFTKFSVSAAVIISVSCYAYLCHVTSHASYNDRIFLEGLPALAIVLCFLALEGHVKFPVWLLIIGDASYSLYLFHPYIIQLVDKKILSLAVVTPFSLMISVAAILACFLAAIISLRLIEKPSNQFLRRYLANVHPPVPAHIPVGYQ